MATSPSQSSTTKRITTTIHDELTWGMVYRNQNAKKNEIPLQLACSPISVHQCSVNKIVKRVSVQPPPEEQLQTSRVKKRACKKEKCVNTTNLHARRVDFLNRSILNQKEYMNLLSVPAIRCYNKPKRRRKPKCIDRCPPRLVKLAIPTKTRVLATWKDHQYFLPSEMIQRLHNLLYTDNNINIKDVRYYFKRCDRRRRRRLRVTLKKKKRRKEIHDKMWTCCEVRNMARLIVNYFIEEPLLDLSYKQLLISSSLINFMGRTGKVRQPLSRNVKKAFPLTIIEICDKLAVWLDNVVRLVEFQPIDDEEEESDEVNEWSPIEEEDEEGEEDAYYRNKDYEEEEEEEEIQEEE